MINLKQIDQDLEKKVWKISNYKRELKWVLLVPNNSIQEVLQKWPSPKSVQELHKLEVAALLNLLDLQVVGLQVEPNPQNWPSSASIQM